MAKTVILAQGDFPRRGGTAWTLLASAQRIVACDGAATTYRRRFGRWPDVIVGDLDSLRSAKGAPCVVRVDDPDTNDLTKALHYCRQHKWRDLVIVGATGRREDHTLGNVFRALEAGVPIVTDTGVFRPVNGKASFRVRKDAGVSVFAPDPKTRMTSRGLRWPLDGVRFANLYCATLNRAVSTCFTVASDRPVFVYVEGWDDVKKCVVKRPIKQFKQSNNQTIKRSNNNEGMQMRRFLLLLAALPLVSSAVEVKSASLAVTLDESSRGRISHLVSASGVDFALGRQKPPAPFSVLVRQVGDVAKSVATEADAAKDFKVETLSDGVRLVYSGFPADRHLERVVCTVRAPKGDMRLRWRLSAVPAAGWALAEAQFPRFYLADRVGATSDDDGFVTGSSGSSGVIRAPGDGKTPHWYRSTRQPGYLAVPLALYYDPSALFYTACEDGRGEVKSFTAYNLAKSGGIFFVWTRHFWAEGEDTQPYDVTMAALAAKPNDPLTWEDGCDLYREWSDRQAWVRPRFCDRKDIPDFLRGRVAYLDIGSRWRDLYAPDGKALEHWAKDCWTARFPGAKGILHFDAWERNGTYIMTDYFPLHPTNEAFRRHADAMCANNIYVNPWPSGFRRAPVYDRREDGTYACDEREEFERTFRPHACTRSDGKLFRRDVGFSWLRGGWFHQMCGGDPWTLDWFAEDITGRLADLGVHGISCDQNIGGGFPECWNRAHGHTPGEGYWKTVAARGTALKSYAALKKRHADAFFCFEEPNELVNDVVQLNNSRQAWGAKPTHAWCSPFDYIYHESAPIFGLGGYGLVGYAHGIANGFMPRCGVRRGDVLLGQDLFPNADFETTEENGAKFVLWDRGSAPNGPDFEVKHSGRASLRVAHPGGTNRWDHVARNLDCEDGAFVPGETYRFSAWMKLGKGKIWCDIGVFGGKGSLGWTRLEAPTRPEDGWKLVTAELRYPKGDVNMLRLMFNLKPGSVGWVDDMTVERKLPDGTYRRLVYEGAARQAELERKWIEFYAGPAHDWVAYGRRVKAPRVDCGTVDYPGGPRPAVFCGAFVSPAGKRAIVFANASAEEQKFTWRGPDGVPHADSLAAAGMKLVEW